MDKIVVVKRSGQRVNFNVTKIAIAIKNAFDSVQDEYEEVKINSVFEKVLHYIELEYKERKTINVEDIQDIIEKVLQEEKYNDIYESFSNYRIRRAASRKVFSVKEQHKFVKAVEKIALTVKEENHSKPQDIISNFGRIISTEFASSYLLDNKFVRAHEEGNIYIYDISNLAIGSFHSCNINLNSLELNDSYFDNLINNLKLSKLEVSHEIALSKIDVLLSPYLIYKFKQNYMKNITKYLKLIGLYEYVNIRKIEIILEKENGIEFNTNIFDQCIYNNQVKNIFQQAYKDSMDETKINLDKNIKKLLSYLNDSNYSFSLGTCTTNEGKIISEIYLENISNFSKIKTIFKVKNKFNLNLNDPNYYLLKKSIELLKIGTNILFSFPDNNSKEEEIEYFSSGERIYENKSSLKNESIGRLILAKTSINLPRIALDCMDKNLKQFNEELEETLNLIKNQLLLTFELQSKKTKENYNCLFQNNLLDDEKLETNNNKIRKIIKNGTLNIDIVGLKECANYLAQKEKLVEHDVSKNILTTIYKICDDFTNEYKLNFVISMCNSYNVSKKLLAIDKTVYGIVEGITDKEVYQSIDYDINQIVICQNQLNGGYLLEIPFTSKDSYQKVYDEVKSMEEKGIRIIKFRKKARE